jgi:hypothetical protein
LSYDADTNSVIQALPWMFSFVSFSKIRDVELAAMSDAEKTRQKFCLRQARNCSLRDLPRRSQLQALIPALTNRQILSTSGCEVPQRCADPHKLSSQLDTLTRSRETPQNAFLRNRPEHDLAACVAGVDSAWAQTENSNPGVGSLRSGSITIRQYPENRPM